jgi:hypothetical protein
MLYWIYSNLCGAERLEDTVFLKSHLDNIPDLANPSPDRISGIFRSLASPLTITNSNNDVEHEFSIHKPLNSLMVDIAKRLKTINSQTLDYDNVIIETEKYDSCWTYKKTKGYQPGVAFIGKTPVYIEARNGNSPAVYKMKDTLKRCLQLLTEKKIPIKHFRSDSAAYQNDVIKVMEKYKIQFFIRASNSSRLKENTQRIRKWTKVNSKGFDFELGEMNFIPFLNHSYNPKMYRAVVKRVWTNGKYHYYTILTNNKSMSAMQVLDFYNQRGAIERNFDDLKNNFNWSRIPFSFLNENLVFLIVSAIASIIYQYVINKFSKKVDFVKRTFRLKNFIFHFITIGSIWKNGKLKLFTNKNYEKIFV